MNLGWQGRIGAHGLATALVAAGLLAAQPAPEFEVASIRQVPHSKARFRVGEPSLDLVGGRLTTQDSLKGLIEVALDVRGHQIAGPPWLDADTFLVEAKAPSETGTDQTRLMCLALLRERFHLTFHREQRLLSVDALLPAKGGPKLRSAADADNSAAAAKAANKNKSKPGRIISSRATMTWLTDALARQLGRPVVDNTGISGEYRILLDWTPGAGEVVSDKPAKTKPGDSTAKKKESAPSIFTAIQEQLGLRLVARKALADVVVIDHVDRTPTEN